MEKAKQAGACKGPSSVPGQVCGREVVALGLCSGHYAQQEKRGQPLTPLFGPHGQRQETPLEARIDVGMKATTREACAGVGRKMGHLPRLAAASGARAVLEAWERGELVPKSKRATPHLVREDTSGA